MRGRSPASAAGLNVLVTAVELGDRRPVEAGVLDQRRRHLGVEAEPILFGHGDPWRGGTESAFEAALAAGRS